jgi:hypothetical protein
MPLFLCLRLRHAACVAPSAHLIYYFCSKEQKSWTLLPRSGYRKGPDDEPRDKGRWLNFRELYQTTAVDRIDLIRSGVSAADFKTFVSGLDVQQEKVFTMLDIATATVNRKASRNESLSREDSEKVVGMAKLIGQVEDDARRIRRSGPHEGLRRRPLAHPLDGRTHPRARRRISRRLHGHDRGPGDDLRLLATMQTGAYA